MHNHSSEFQTFAKSMHRNLSLIRMVPIILVNSDEIMDFLKKGANTPEKRQVVKIWELNWKHLLDAFSLFTLFYTISSPCINLRVIGNTRRDIGRRGMT